MQNDLNILITEEDKKRIVVKDVEIFIGRLSFKKTVKLAKMIAKIFSKYANQFKTIKTTGTTNAEDINQILEMVDETELAEIIALVIDKDAEFALALPPSVSMDIVATFIEFNKDEITALIKNVQRITGAMEALKK